MGMLSLSPLDKALRQLWIYEIISSQVFTWLHKQLLSPKGYAAEQSMIPNFNELVQSGTVA